MNSRELVTGSLLICLSIRFDNLVYEYMIQCRGIKHNVGSVEIQIEILKGWCTANIENMSLTF